MHKTKNKQELLDEIDKIDEEAALLYSIYLNKAMPPNESHNLLYEIFLKVKHYNKLRGDLFD